jgi:hypothetical protein
VESRSTHGVLDVFFCTIPMALWSVWVPIKRSALHEPGGKATPGRAETRGFRGAGHLTLLYAGRGRTTYHRPSHPVSCQARTMIRTQHRAKSAFNSPSRPMPFLLKLV